VDNCTNQSRRKDDVAGTGFGLLPFLAAGQTHKPAKDRKETQKDYSKGIDAALKFLISKQQKNGNFGGTAYSHGIATIAMCEAYGLTSDPVLKVKAQMAINFIVDSQDPNGGGWRYSPRSPGDMSVTGWMIMALKSGQMTNLSVPVGCLKKAEQFVDSCQVGQSSGTYSYLPNGQATPAMTAVGMLCKMYLGVGPRNPTLLKGIDYLKTNPPTKTENLYYEYYATQVMHHVGGEHWDFWNKGPGGNGKGGIRDYLIGKMDSGNDPKRPTQKGSWAPTQQGHVSEGGRVMATSLSLLTLEVYYRHLPLYRRDAAAQRKEE